MKQQQVLYGIIGLLAGILITVIFASNAVNNNSAGMMSMMGINQPANQVNRSGMMGNIDAHFIEQMIPHHEDAITMSRLAPEKAVHPEIKTLAESIITSQSAEITLMKDWYKEWYGREIPAGSEVMQSHGMMGGGMHMGMMGGESDIKRLEGADDFDKVFIEEMIPHHQMAVMMANMLKNGTDRPEMKKLAEDIISAQTKEIDLMRQWYRNWGYE